MFLSSEKIKEAIKLGKLIITPYSETKVKPVSYNFSLDKILKDVSLNKEIIIFDEGYILKPGDFVIAKTTETINLNNKYICILSNRSSLAQQGLDVLQSSTIAEPDTNGQFTLEIKNNGPKTVYLMPGMKIVKGIFSEIN